MYWSDVAHQVIVETGINNSTDVTVLVHMINITIPGRLQKGIYISA